MPPPDPTRAPTTAAPAPSGQAPAPARAEGTSGSSAASTRGAAADVRGGIGAAAVLERHPRGIPVAIYLMPTDVDRAEWVRDFTGKTVAQAQKKLLGASDNPRALAALAAMATAGRAETNSDDAARLAAAKFENDLEFSRLAPGHAAARASVALNGGVLALGQAMAYTRQEPDRWKQNIKGVSDAVGPLPAVPGAAPGSAAPQGAHQTAAEAAGPAPAPAASAAPAPSRGPAPILANNHNVSEVAIFTHGGSRSIDLGRWIGASHVAPFLASAVTGSVNVQLYACSAGTDGGFGEQLSEQVSAATGGSVNVLGHETAAHTTRNSQGRTFRAQAGRQTLDVTNFDAIFSAEFLASEATRLADALHAEVAQVQGLLATVALTWLNLAGKATPVDIRGAPPTPGERPGRRAPTSVTAAQAIGVDFEGTVRLVREAWTAVSEARVRAAIDRAAARARPRRRAAP